MNLFEQTPELLEHSETIGWLIYPMASFYNLSLVLFIFLLELVFLLISVLYCLTFMKKRGDYLQIWRTSAIAMTVPILINNWI